MLFSGLPESGVSDINAVAPAKRGGVLMYVVKVDDAIMKVFASPVAAELYAADLRRYWKLDAYVVYE